METHFFGVGRLASSKEYMDDEQPFGPRPFWPHPQGMVPFCTPGSWMLSSAPCFTISSFASSPLPWDSGQCPEVFIDNAAVDRFSNNMALERLLPTPADSDFQQAVEIPKLAPSAASIDDKEDKEPRHVHSSRSTKQQRELASLRKPTGLKPPKVKKRARKSKATPQKGGKGGHRGATASEDEICRKRLERNRLAAERCRHRKRDEAQALAAKEEALESQSRHLFSCFHMLKEEVLRLRTELLQHTNCDCVLIREYIAREAQRTVDGLAPHSSTPAIHHGKARGEQVTEKAGSVMGAQSTFQIPSETCHQNGIAELLVEQYFEHDTAREPIQALL
ncbi:BZIP domain-containing protein [Fusarium keratoplasticum]|uniref:BZIP domain-containing protein n=1 Tax=Fusarium keratoplasticum TaxID=1328300 RepID=A0ACC0QCD6_9HYPO|nr:BZIP domain-containing protein [Fusarium keratoplasticum]KAI8648709.1 BZIP domain-containing protein [Fusarium keratoplasticum]